jgi:predicted phosphodiesterase
MSMTQTESFAVLADIHGNAAALKAVLDHARQRGVTRFFNLGDTFYGPLDPAGTWAILRQTPMDSVLGNQDRILLEPAPAPDMVRAIGRTLDDIDADGLAWLKGLPATLRPEPDVLLCHGTPENDTAYLLEDVSTGLPGLRPCADILADIADVADGCTLVLTGHSHHAGLANCGPVTVINPGSVGLPAYTDDVPPHAMASGSPHARYAVVSRTGDGWQADLLTVEYDWSAAAETARKNGREDWARWLTTGLA